MAYYNICPKCGAHLDPGEPCDCEEEKESVKVSYMRLIKTAPETGQMTFCLEGEGQ